MTRRGFREGAERKRRGNGGTKRNGREEEGVLETEDVLLNISELSEERREGDLLLYLSTIRGTNTSRMSVICTYCT